MPNDLRSTSRRGGRLAAFVAPLLLGLPFLVTVPPEPIVRLAVAAPTSPAPITPAVERPAAVITRAAPPVAARRATPRRRGVSVCGVALCLDGLPRAFSGVNAYELATSWGINWGCGTQVTDTEVDRLFESLPAHSMVRFWAFQAQAFNNKTTHAIDFRPLDRIVSAAERHRQHLILTLTTQDGTCDDGHWKDAAWYRGGYRSANDDFGRGLTPLSYLRWVNAVVKRYRSSPAVAMWEPVNEPEASGCASGWHGWDCWGHLSCPSFAVATAAIRSFFDHLGRTIHALDGRHLVSSGALGGDQCGWAGDGYSTVHASRGIDVASYHDYGSDTEAITDGIQLRIAQAHRLGKPIIAGEVGVAGGAKGSCPNLASRARMIRAKLHAQRAAAFLVWDWSPATDGSCGFGFSSSDPLIAALAP